LGIEINGYFKVYPFVELEKTNGDFTDTVNGRQLLIRYNSEHRTGTILDQQGNELPGVATYWFAWYAFHPETEIFSGLPK